MNHLFCKDCNKQLDSVQNWQAHVIGKAHQSRVRTIAATSAQMFCRFCKKQCDSPSNFQQHCKSKAHLLRAGPSNVPAAPPTPVFNLDISDDEDEWEVVPQPKSAQVLAHDIYKLVIFANENFLKSLKLNF